MAESSSNGSGAGNGDKLKSAAKTVVPMVASAAAFTGGALLKQKLMPKRRKVLGMSMPAKPKVGAKPMGKQLSKAGRQAATVGQRLGRLSGDVERAGRTAQRVGDSMS